HLIVNHVPQLQEVSHTHRSRLVETLTNTWRILKERKEAGALPPKMYFAIGKNDFLYDLFSRFRTFAQEIDLGVTFEEFEGYKHEWRFWDMTIQRALEFFGITGNDAGNPF
ncbi:MAG: hypothetical protein PHD32_11400, partial [Eubacteriales bacterium]|nr:hypothetical protein [Eubacteriales bacterium]